MLWLATRRDGLKSTIRMVRRVDVETGELTRLRNEALLLHGLDHANVVKLHGWYEEQNAVYTAVECCDGEFGELQRTVAWILHSSGANGCRFILCAVG